MSEATRESVRIERNGAVTTVILDRPHARNAVDGPTAIALYKAFDEFDRDESASVAVLWGDHGTFCAGADLAGASQADSDSFAHQGPGALVAVLEAMLDHPKPIVARVQGHVAGGGNGLVAASDLAVASASAKFAFSEVRVGVAPAVISVVCLARMTPAHARELLLTGERVSADRVKEAGLVTAVADDDALDGVVSSYVDALLRGGPTALARTKELLTRVPAMQRDDAFAYTAELSASLFASDEAREGMTAFLERRPASWTPQP